MPAWVAAEPRAEGRAARAADVGGRRELLVDLQTNHNLPRAQFFVRSRAVALDAATLGSVSQPQISFNPAFQRVMLHSVAVWRQGTRLDRLADARIEPMRRERRLEQSVIDGNETLLLVLSDVGVGEPVEVVYTVEGENPIFEGRIFGQMNLAFSSPVDLLHQRVLLPAQRPVKLRSFPQAFEPERSIESGQQVLRLVREQVAGIVQEPGTPPWVVVFPGIEYTEFADWAEVDAWAQRLFAVPAGASDAVAAKAAELKARGLQGEGLLTEAVRFVQDDVRYFSVSLGESSHRPKPPNQTLAERLGDCKDKAQLLNTLLRELGFDARPALVSMHRNRGVTEQLPSPNSFDHVISRVEFGGATWFIDGTATGQGVQLATRGRYPYGAALVVGTGQGPQAVPEAPAGNSRIEYLHEWNLSHPGAPAELVITMRAHGHSAERWRAVLAEIGGEQAAQAASAGLARVHPGLVPKLTATVADDRQANVLELKQGFSLPQWGRYDFGALVMETAAIELFDALATPNETQRRLPYLLDHPRLLESRISLTGPVALPSGVPESREVADRHFRYTVRLEMKGQTATFIRRLERRADQVMPADISAWREKLGQARGTLTGNVRLPLLTRESLNELVAQVDKSYRPRGSRDDTLQRMLMRNEFSRALDSTVLQRVPADSLLAGRILASRAQTNNLLGAHQAGLVDAERALQLASSDADAHEAKGVALLGLGRADQALEAFTRLQTQTKAPGAAVWLGSLELILGRPSQAETWLREAVAQGSGNDRDFALIWLYLAGERQGGRGQAAVADQLDSADATKFTGALLHYLVGRIDQDELLRRAGQSPDMQRLNLTEAWFFVGQKHIAQGRRDDARRWFERTLESQATPHRELSLARLELRQAGKP